MLDLICAGHSNAEIAAKLFLSVDSAASWGYSQHVRALRGCVYIDPPGKQGADAEICWWATDGPGRHRPRA